MAQRWKCFLTRLWIQSWISWQGLYADRWNLDISWETYWATYNTKGNPLEWPHALTRKRYGFTIWERCLVASMLIEGYSWSLGFHRIAFFLLSLFSQVRIQIQSELPMEHAAMRDIIEVWKLITYDSFCSTVYGWERYVCCIHVWDKCDSYSRSLVDDYLPSAVRALRIHRQAHKIFPPDFLKKKNGYSC